SNGNPKTLEFNCRFGDPETQPILMRLESDIIELLEYGFSIKLDQATVYWYDGYAVGVVLASHGYPSKSRINDIISGLELVNNSEVKAFYAGVEYRNSKYYTSGGRVVCVTVKDSDLKTAQFKAYEAIKKINFAGMQYRTDIGNSAFS
ncbi:MAG: phosphoribosylamine--glycine ligase, partial [Burkholderiales bacterium]|nr:phosphoribosylamine--glycine ligase [Burkholderiales bacterium]